MEVVAGTVKEAQWADVDFAWTVAKHVDSNAIVVSRGGQTLGIGAGQTSRVDAVRPALDKARGPEFDRLFLEGMIRHHQGAIDMVDALFKAYGAAQDEVIFRFASDVYADQSTEIARMQKMLEAK